MRSQTDRRPPQRSDYRREAILDALDTWLQESNLDAINIAEISKQAGVTRSAFYFYFENKGAAVAALMVGSSRPRRSRRPVGKKSAALRGRISQ